MVAEPVATPVTSPIADTVAAAGLLLVQLTTRPVSTFPAASFVVAANCTVPPGATVAVAGVTVTTATGAPRFTTKVPDPGLGLQATGPNENEAEMLAPPLLIVPEPVMSWFGQTVVSIIVNVKVEPLIVPLIVPPVGVLPADVLHVPVIAAPVCTNWNSTGPENAPEPSVLAPLTVPV